MTHKESGMLEKNPNILVLLILASNSVLSLHIGIHCWPAYKNNKCRKHAEDNICGREKYDISDYQSVHH